jgi:hypothetical protein
MLDFYLIQDDQPKPNYPEQAELEIAGGLDYESYEYLISKGFIDKRFDYYSDFRWGAAMIKQIIGKINQGGFKNDSKVKKFYDLINLAFNKKCGLIAYCD